MAFTDGTKKRMVKESKQRLGKDAQSLETLIIRRERNEGHVNKKCVILGICSSL